MIDQTITSDIWIDPYRPDIFSPESKARWDKFHTLVRKTSVPIAVNGVFDFVQTIIDSNDPNGGYLGGGMHYKFWFKTVSDRTKFLDELDVIIPSWRALTELSATVRETKQMIVMRADLNMRKGKMVAQGAHASMKALLDIMPSGTANERTLDIEHNPALFEWLNGSFTKVCVRVDSEAELEAVYQQAQDAGLISALIVDSGKTEFNSVPTRTCCAIGPAYADELQPITGHLKLL